MSTQLFPPLEIIRSELFDTDAPLAGFDESLIDQEAPVIDAASVRIPDYARALMARIVATREAHPLAPPAIGQIRSLTTITDAAGLTVRSLGRACGVLLGAPLDGARWSGWLVAQEVDYATDRDLVIEDTDGPMSPEAGMVQTWNPLRIHIGGDEAILGRLAPDRLATVMALAGAAQAGGSARPQPGKVYAWDLDDRITVVTGSPLGGKGDPRCSYRALYRQLGAEIANALTEKCSAEGHPRSRPG
jgi:hypothetical protein